MVISLAAVVVPVTIQKHINIISKIACFYLAGQGYAENNFPVDCRAVVKLNRLFNFCIKLRMMKIPLKRILQYDL